MTFTRRGFIAAGLRVALAAQLCGTDLAGRSVSLGLDPPSLVNHVPEILAKGLIALRENSVMPRLIAPEVALRVGGTSLVFPMDDR